MLLLLGALAVGAGACGGSGRIVDQNAATVFSAGSTVDVMTELAQSFEEATGSRIRCSFASSSILARQIESGAQVDIFVSANPRWMDFLQDQDLIEAGSRCDLLANRMALVAPAGKTVGVDFDSGFDLAATVPGRLAVGDPDHVPAGIYAKAALSHYGWFEPLHDRLATAMNVRAALRLVEIGAADLGVVYETDAAASLRVELVGLFPEESHDPIRYPIAFCREPTRAGRAFYDYLTSAEAAAVFARYGFTPLKAAEGES